MIVKRIILAILLFVVGLFFFIVFSQPKHEVNLDSIIKPRKYPYTHPSSCPELLLMGVGTKLSSTSMEHNYSCDFIYSVLAHNIPFHFLGYDETNPQNIKKSLKPKYLHKSLLLLNQTCPNTIVMVLDTYDTLLQHGKKEILDAFRSLKAKIIFSAEKTCHPRPNYCQTNLIDDIELLHSLYHKTDGAPQYINSGGIIGSTQDLLALVPLLSDISLSVDDDQDAANRLYKQNKHDIKLDVFSTIFQSLHRSLNDLKKLNGSDYYSNIYTKTSPAALHFNGNAKHAYFSIESKSALLKDSIKFINGSRTGILRPSLNEIKSFYLGEKGESVRFSRYCNMTYQYSDSIYYFPID